MLGIWHFYGTQVDGSDFVKVLPNATVTVRRESDGGLAEIEGDIDGSSPGLDNPFTSGDDGEISFYADPDERYRIDIVSGALTLTLRHQSVSTPPMSEFVPWRGHIAGLTLSNNSSDATNDIDIAVGECADAAVAVLMKIESALTKRLDAAWAVGSGNGGLDTGSIADDVYHVWLIRRPDTGVVDALFSASATSPTMPSGYTQKRRIGAIIRDSGAILAFSQLGDEFLLSVPENDYNASNPGTSATLRALTVPDGIKVIALHAASLFDLTSTGNIWALVTSPDQADTTPSSTLFTLGLVTPGTTDDVSDFVSLRIRTDTSGRIRTRLDASDADVTIRGTTYGWVDHRGRHD